MTRKLLFQVTVACFCLLGIYGCDTPHNNIKKATNAADSRIKTNTIAAEELNARSSIPKPRSAPIRPVLVYGLRKFPYPYKSMLAISSDADHQTLRKFNLIHKFLNTTLTTPMGKGLGLDVGDSFFMYNGSNLLSSVDIGQRPIGDEFTYFRGLGTQVYGGTVIDSYIQNGWIDSIHTFGDFSQRDQTKSAFSRQLAVQAIQTLKLNNDYVNVWIDHGNKSNVDNFGSFGTRRFYSYQQGANPGSPYYHTDLTIPFGIKFVWTDQSSEVFGHDTMIYPLQLPSGQRVWGFWRFTNATETRFGLVNWLWSSDDIANELTPANLSWIVRHHQYAIVAQHLSSDNELLPLSRRSRTALSKLANEYHKGNILVARTSRLLQYNLTNQFLEYTVAHGPSGAVINIQAVDDPIFGTKVPTVNDLKGITFYTSDPAHTQVQIKSTPVPPQFLQANPSDGEEPSISIKWWAPDYTDHSLVLPGVM